MAFTKIEWNMTSRLALEAVYTNKNFKFVGWLCKGNILEIMQSSHKIITRFNILQALEKTNTAY